MQWRLAISGLVAYFGYGLFTPVIFAYHGDVEAGRMGMTWTLATVLHAGAIAWVQVRAPLFGVLISRRDYAELDRVFHRVFRVSFTLLAMACTLFLALIVALNFGGLWPADRLLPPLPTALFLLAILLNHIPASQNFYMRAHRREVVLVRNVISASSIGLLVWLLGRWYGSVGAAGAYLGVTVLFTLPYQAYLFRRFQEEIAPDRAAGPIATAAPDQDLAAPENA
jgi:O-antigen/teichoic acid export membrane protein